MWLANVRWLAGYRHPRHLDGPVAAWLLDLFGLPMPLMKAAARVGDRVAFDGAEHQVAVVSGSWVRLVGPNGTPKAMLLIHMVSSPGFDILGDPAEPRTVLADHVLAGVAEDVAQRARQWEDTSSRSRPGSSRRRAGDSAAK